MLSTFKDIKLFKKYNKLKFEQKWEKVGEIY